MAKTLNCKFQAVLLVAIILVSVFNTRLKHIVCPLCHEDVACVSLVEYNLGPWKEIPTLHPLCQDQIANVLAPNNNMGLTEWLRIRGYYDERFGTTTQERIEKIMREYPYAKEES